MLRPRWGYGSDVGGRRTPWIIGGMAVLALGGVAARRSPPRWMAAQPRAPASRSPSSPSSLIGVGVGAAGTSLLVLLAKRVDARSGARPRRPSSG